MRAKPTSSPPRGGRQARPRRQQRPGTKPTPWPPPLPDGSPRHQRQPRRMRRYQLSAAEMVRRLRLTYLHFCELTAPSIAWLARRARIPYETLRHFLTAPKHMLCPENEENLARALGHDSAYYRQLVTRWHGGYGTPKKTNIRT